MKSRLRLVVGCLLSVCLLSPAYAESRPSVVFLSPDDSRFWIMVADFMTAVASDLEMDLSIEVDRDSHRFSYLNLLRSVLNRPDKPDYLVFMCKEEVTARMLRLANDAGVKVFTFNTDVPAEAQRAVGLPRQSLANWIGHLSPDNVAAGRRLTDILGQQASDLGLIEPAQPLSLIALSGTRDSSAAKDRNTGLLKVVNDQRATLSQLVHAGWSTEEARKKTRVLLKRYPDTKSIWSASDGMALGAIEAARVVGMQPGTDLVIGGVDWEPRALAAIREGELAVSLGRHFMGGGLLMLLLHDYHRGQDFVSGDQVPLLRYELEPATRKNVARVERIMDPDHWRSVRFERFSQALNPDPAPRWHNTSQLMDAFASALATQGQAENLVSQD
ncbi:ABC transporter substrate-binding protein [Marinobacter sp. F4206]|uniref:ABC transporter substrate-binding protein n=1 Tax=Marinobacter sp. F4206 TaxID=2861777 RepID=UPI001C5F8407|nr:ABC transporter substrate-binding protein [Marinobacter sp. F4206]MBW4934939.1 ABC transporter substrate-binding protein [Marinobacter sp. F4206]